MKINKIGAAYSIYKNRKGLGTMLKAVRNGEYKLGLMTYVAGFIAMAYAIWPLDILPDFIPGFGWLDDTAAILLLVKQLKNELKKYKEGDITKQNWVITKQ